MTNTDQIPMTETKQKIVQGAIGCFVHYGARKTSMNDIAREAGVSRQTLYDLFGGKDDLIRASILQITDMSLADIERQLPGCSSLGEKIDLYFHETVIKSFELLQIAREPEDLISGHNKAGADAIKEAHARMKALITRVLTEHQGSSGTVKTEDLANYVVTVSMNFKYVKDRDELEELLNVLKQSVIKLAG